MLPEIERFQRWLRRKAPHTSTHIHYTNDVELFFAWINKNPGEVTVRDVDAFIEHSQAQGHAIATINRRLAALQSFFHFLAIETDQAPRNPVLPRRHYIRQGLPLPRDVQDPVLEKLFAVIHDPRDRVMFLLMLRCGMRVSEIRNLSLKDLYLEPAPGSLPRLWLHGKGGKQRVVYLSAQPLAALKTWLEVRPSSKDQAVFLNKFGKRLTVIGIVHIINNLKNINTFVDDLLAMDALVFLCSCLLSYWALRVRSKRRMHHVEHIADIIFIIGMIVMVVACGFIVYAVT
ncbi:MAG: tyrosine-type recombinase/integrase [Anaerolineales bacterium]